MTSRKRQRSRKVVLQEWKIPSGLHPQVHPLHRHKTLQRLIEIVQFHLGSNDGRARKRKREWDRREAFKYAMRLEQRVAYLCECDAQKYEDKIAQLFWNFRTNGAHLIPTYPPDMLIALDDEHLDPKAAMAHLKTYRKVRGIKFETLIRKLTSDESSGGSGLLTCRKCKSNKIDFNPQQTRGADEPMTIFCSCLNCHSNWKMM
jgi:DNA-directed RNA polymerase subunit M/transcription elongation factor TFIIS